MKLPNAERAVVDIKKLRDYSLNGEHEVGKHKARVFRTALGLTATDAEWLRELILRSARRRSRPVVALPVRRKVRDRHHGRA